MANSGRAGCPARLGRATAERPDANEKHACNTVRALPPRPPHCAPNFPATYKILYITLKRASKRRAPTGAQAGGHRQLHPCSQHVPHTASREPPARLLSLSSFSFTPCVSLETPRGNIFKRLPNFGGHFLAIFPVGFRCPAGVPKLIPVEFCV
jgi:hypothetical protein